MQLTLDKWWQRLAVIAIVALTVVAGAFVLGLAERPSQDLATPAPDTGYDTDELVPDRLPSNGGDTSDVDTESFTVLIDRSHQNRVSTSSISPLLGTITQAGGTIRYTNVSSSLEADLSSVDAYVVMDPGQPFATEDVDAVDSFVEDGGHVLLMGEPDRTVIATGFGSQFPTEHSHFSPLSNRLGVSFGIEYLYKMSENDGNYRNVITSPASGGNTITEGIDQTTMYTATHVRTTDGTVLLETTARTNISGSAVEKQYPVAVTAREGNVVAVGDKTFLEPSRVDIVDNRRFTNGLVEFLQDGK